MSWKPVYLLLLVFSLLALLVYRTLSPVPSPISTDDTIKQLINILNDEQIKKDTGFLPPISFIENEGLYKSNVKLNFFGTYPHYLLRHYFAVPDSNMFITNFVALALLESWELGTIDLPEDQLNLALDAILKFKDKNSNTSDIYCFWLQELVEQYFVASPLNLIYGIDIFLKGSDVFKFILENIGLGFVYEKYIYPFVNMFNIYSAVFKIPSDADDSSVNLALYGKLSQFKEKLPNLYRNWTDVNRNLNATLQAYLKYSYKPFSNITEEKLIDPRTYYYLRDFLKTKENITDFSLISTWITNLDEDRERFPEVGMPLHVNNIDLSVNTNSLFGLTHVFLTNPELVTPELLRLYSDVTDLVVWAIESEIVLKRPDVTILYYPSIYDFYWFAARVLSFLEKFSEEELKFPELLRTKEKFAKVLREKGVHHIVNLAKEEAETQRVFWEDFLGCNDSYPTGEDRLFSTGLAINMLIDSWTNHTKTSSKIQWRNDTPAQIISFVEKSIKFVKEEILADNYLKENAFFSGSIKGNSSDSFSYPYNFMRYLNGSAVLNVSNADFTQISSGISGIVEENLYQQWLNMTWNGRNVPLSFQGFNEQAFPYWSSPAMTYALGLMALSKSEKINL